jgi:AraC family transcriptional regulator, regulatory protein of adaptative response / DNA-3-methyladenine glycosylase II
MKSPVSTGRERAQAGHRERVVDLPFTPPYDWPALLRFFQSHAIPGLERVTDEVFTRVFRLGAIVGSFEVSVIAVEATLQLRIAAVDPVIDSEIVRRVRRMFDLDCDPTLIADRLRASPLLAALGKRFPGLRVARGWDPFETAICSILGQLVTAGQRTKLIGQLVENYGDKVVDPRSGEQVRLFPDARVLAKSKLDLVRTTVARREAIRDLSRRVLSGAIRFSAGQDPAVFRAAMQETKGLGSWSAEYISLRAMGDMDAFPKTDLILKRALALHSDLDLQSLSPWRAYAATYLWQEYAETLSRSRRNGEAITTAGKQREQP